MTKTRPLGTMSALSSEDEIRTTLRKFQDAYIRKDITEIPQFMNELFLHPGLIVIGTGPDELCQDVNSATRLFEWDWENWGDVELDVSGAKINYKEEVAWLMTQGKVTKTFEPDNLPTITLENIHKELGSDHACRQKLLEIMRSSAGALMETECGNSFVWPFRFSAVLVKTGSNWLFTQIHFSFPTVGNPDVRIL
jgi:hypothetical protein